jgi:hypothetical protein
MSTSSRRMTLAVSALTGLLALAACASAPGGSPAPSSTTVPSDQRLEDAAATPPHGRVLGMGTVIDVAGDAKLCLGAILESYPPQCAGLPLDDWTWEGLDGSDSSGDTRWGAYAVTGMYDGERLTVTEQPIMLALFDPIAPEDPTGGVDGSTPAAELTAVQDDIAARLSPDAVVMSDRGYVWVMVTWDDGTLQAAADAEYGTDVVIVTSALREID